MDIRLGAALAAGWIVLAASGSAAAQSRDFGLGSGLRIAETSPWTFQVSGLVSHFKEPSCTDCSYRTGVPGIGLQRDFTPWADSPVRYSFAAGLQTDSFGESGGYAAAVASLSLRGESLVFKPGIGGFAFYRYMDHGNDRDTASREVVPAILPVLAVESVRTGFGATLLVAPNFSYAGRDRSGFVFLQFSYRLGRDAGGPAFGLAAGPDAAASDGEGRPRM